MNADHLKGWKVFRILPRLKPAEYRSRITVFVPPVIVSFICLVFLSMGTPCNADNDSGMPPPLKKGESVKRDNSKITRIGFLAPLSGHQVSETEHAVRGTRMAIDEINRAGGVRGYKFELVVEDVKKSDPQDILSAIERLLNDDKVNIIVTDFAGHDNFEIDVLAKKNMLYFVNANAGETEKIISRDPEKYMTVWSYVPSYAGYHTELPLMMNYLEASGLKLADHKVAIIGHEHEYSRNIALGLRDFFKKNNWDISLFKILTGDIHDWRPILGQIRKESCSLIVFTDPRMDTELFFLEQFSKKPIPAHIFIQFGPSNPRFIEQAGELATGITYNSMVSPIPNSALAQKEADRYKKMFGMPPSIYSHVLYWVIKVYASALEKVGDPAKHLEIGKKISQTDMTTSHGRLKFDPETHLAVFGEDFFPLLFFQIWGNKRNVIFPPRYITDRYRTPPWFKLPADKPGQ